MEGPCYMKHLLPALAILLWMVAGPVGCSRLKERLVRPDDRAIEARIEPMAGDDMFLTSDGSLTEVAPGRSTVTQVIATPGYPGYPTTSGNAGTPGSWQSSASSPTLGAAAGTGLMDRNGARSHTIRRGDTLWAIARANYGSGARWRDIQAANPGINPRRLLVGKQIRLP